MEDNTVTKDDGWGQIDTSQPESKEKEDKVNFEVENSSEEKEVKVEPVIEKEEEKKEEPKLETKEEEETQPEEQPDEAKDIDSKRAQKRIRQLVRQRKEKEEEVARLLAKQNYLDAFEKDDKSQLLKAQEALNEAQINLNNVKTNKINFDKDYENYQNSIKQQPVQQSQPQQPQYDPKAVAWAENNEWFGQDKIMTAAALALDAQLKEEGFNPADDDFYKEVDVRLKDAFPNKFKTSEQETQQVRQKATSSPSQVVAGTSRTPASKKIKLSQEDVRLANKWNIPLDRYAKEKSKVETGEEYTTITTQMRRS
jgi:hypothetical protein